MPTKILVIGPSSVHVSRFINLVRDLFDEVVFIGEGELTTDFPVKQHIVNFRAVNPVSIWKNYQKLARIIASENPTVTHIHQVNRLAYAASRILNKQKRKGVITAWGSDVLLIPKRHWLFKRMTVDVLNKAAFITADSGHMITEIQKLTRNKNIDLVFFGIDPIPPLPKEKMVYSNRALEELYNIDRIIDAFFEFNQTHPDWKLVVASTGKKQDALQTQVKQLGIQTNVEFVGWLSGAANNNFYQRAAVYISIPSSDGTSISLLEAMSAGCIPVVSDLPVSYEWIESGVNGVIHKQGKNPIVQAVQLDSSKVQQLNAAIIEERATSKAATGRFKAIYDQMAND